jgi:hypothetical protein
MKLQIEILLIIASLNIAVTLVFTLANLGVIPGVTYIYQNNTVITGQTMEETFNGTQTADTWASGQTALNPLNLYGNLNLLAMVTSFFGTIRLLIDGFPALLDWIKFTFISDATGMLVFDAFAWGIRGLFGLMIFLFAIEFISNRNVTD